MKHFFFRTMLHMVLLAITAVWFLPTLGLLISSFRTPAQISGSGWWTVIVNLVKHPMDLDQLTLQNYALVIGRQGLGRSFFNSLLVSLPATLLATFLASLAAYGFAWMRFGGRRFLFLFVIGLMVVPLQMTFIPILPVFRWLGLAGTFLGIWMAHTGYGLPLITFLMYNFISTIPRDIFDSAAMDGASPFNIFYRIVLPISAPALASVFIFQFLWVWNDLLVALIYLGATPDVATVTLSVANLVTNRGQNWELLTAAAFVSMALPLFVFFTMQKFFVRGILAGAIKG